MQYSSCLRENNIILVCQMNKPHYSSPPGGFLLKLVLQRTFIYLGNVFKWLFLFHIQVLSVTKIPTLWTTVLVMLNWWYNLYLYAIISCLSIFHTNSQTYYSGRRSRFKKKKIVLVSLVLICICHSMYLCRLCIISFISGLGRWPCVRCPYIIKYYCYFSIATSQSSSENIRNVQVGPQFAVNTRPLVMYCGWDGYLIAVSPVPRPG